ncbi:hypothetical protein KUTeg_023390 [Tegillarca granosa]|uniref:Uncharacterized protein n=1 Tax=Tegillarca granosa TaxID=220873 RepID=A0ABQ9E2H0_TEGGR|nr:hypothetical protein KUTeg_023390 [Tegillarca granosa]
MNLIHCKYATNHLTSTFSDPRGKQLKFYISKGTDETIFWKPTVRICCDKIRARSNFVESSRNVTSKTCPICRAKVNSIDDTWVLTEKPDSTEYESEVKGYLVGLADRTGNPH